jgi:hypothetical protein
MALPYSIIKEQERGFGSAFVFSVRLMICSRSVLLASESSPDKDRPPTYFALLDQSAISFLP